MNERTNSSGKPATGSRIQALTPRDRLIRLPEVERVTGFKKSTLYGWIKDKTFPRPVQIGRMSAWPESAVLQWVQERISEAQK